MQRLRLNLAFVDSERMGEGFGVHTAYLAAVVWQPVRKFKQTVESVFKRESETNDDDITNASRGQRY